jgi:hypothetical protein
MPDIQQFNFHLFIKLIENWEKVGGHSPMITDCAILSSSGLQGTFDGKSVNRQNRADNLELI